MRIQRCAEPADIDEINRFLNQDLLTNRLLDYFPLEYWMGQPGFVMDQTDGEITGLLLNVSAMPNITWIKLFASIRNTHRGIWKQLFDRSLFEIRENKIRKIASLSFINWYSNLLVSSGFSSEYEIVMLSTQDLNISPSDAGIHFQIRAARLSDLQQIELIDHKSFSDIWQFSLEELIRTLAASGLATLAILNGEIVGYQMSKISSDNSAHLIRLAILPQFQNQHIGKALVSDLFRKLSVHGVQKLTVNTQSNNLASLTLYQHLGFSLTDQNYSVYTLEV